MDVFPYYDQMLTIELRTITTFLLLIHVEARAAPRFAYNVEIPPSFLTMPAKEIIHIPGRPLHIPCTAIGSPEPRYEWYNNGHLLSIGTYADADFNVPKPVTKQYSKSGSEGPKPSKFLLWDFSRLLNSGRLKPGWINCVAANPKGKALSPPTQFRIAELGGSSFCEPLTLTHRNEKFFRLNCSVPRSTPPAKIRWMFRREDGHIGFINENRTFSMDDSGNLYVSVNSLPATSGLTVFCSANNEILRTMRTGCDFRLPSGTASSASPSPLLMYRSESRKVAIFNSTVELRCLISARKDTIIAWTWSSDVYSTIFIHKEGKWVSKDGKPLVPKVQIQLRAENTVLFIPRVTFDHSGMFTCQLQSSASFSTAPIMAEFKLLVESEPFFDEKPTDLTLPIGGSGRLNCFPSRLVLPKPDITWYANGDRIEKFLDGKRKRLSGNTLVFSHVTIRDTAVFQCNISNRNGFAFANAYLNVWDSQPAIVDEPPEMTVCVEKQALTLSCSTVGAPRAVVIWSKDGNLQLGSNRNTSERKFSRFDVRADGSLLISSVERSDSGTYTCVASNMFGQSTASGKVLVRRQSKVTQGPVISGAKSPFKMSKTGKINITWIDAGSAVSLTCRGETDVMEFDSLAIKWTRHRINANCMAVLRLQSDMLYDGRFCETDGPPVEILETSRRKLGQNAIESSITLQNVQPHDTGYYRCSAFNKLDNDSATVVVIVQGPPEPPTAVKLDCKHEAATQKALLVWEPGSDNNAPITDISLEYIHGAYRPLNLKQLEAPGISATKLLEDLQSALLNDDWQPMKHVLVNVEPDFSTFSSSQALVNLTGHMATMALYPDVAYQFRLRLINAAGRSGPSSVVPGFENEMGSTCIFPPQPPATQPEDVVIYGNKPNNLVISWEIIPPLQHGGPGLQYHVTLRCLNCDYEFPAYSKTDNVSLNWKENKVIFSADTTSHKAAVHKLYPIEIFKKYEIRLTTSNLAGFSQSPPVILVGWSAEAQPMLAPKNLRVANIEAASVDVLWDWPAVDDIAKQINGFFVGFRISWCPADKPFTICERYKVMQDVICAHPMVELFPEMRISSEGTDRLHREEIGGWSKGTGNVQSSHTTTVRLSNNPFYQLRSATVTDLPGDTNIRLWICLLNIQYSGPKSEVIYVRTKEGVPGPVADFIHSFSGVNYVEVTWSKPTQLNGILTGYIIDVISGNPEQPHTLENELRENWSIVPYYQKQINDSDQMAARLSRLKMDSAYKLIIRAKTSSGPGKPRELIVHTAKSRSATSPVEFTVSPVYGSATTLNVSLVISNIGTLNDDNRISDNGSHHTQAPSPHSYILDRSSLASAMKDTYGSQNGRERTPNRGKLRHAGLQDGYFSPKTAVKSIQAFAVQFKRPVDETWEETEREYEKSWMVVRNLIPGQEYDMRIILAKTPALSFVSQVRILRVPRPGEVGLGLLNAETERKSEMRGGGHTSEGTFSLFGSSVAFQVLLPLICLLCLLLLTTAGVCCWRNYGRQPLGSRQIHFSPVDASSSSSPARVSLREIHVAQKLHRGTQGRKDKDKRTAEVAKGLVRFQNSFTDSHNLPEYSKENYSAGDEEERRCAQIKPLQASTSMLRTLKKWYLFTSKVFNNWMMGN